MYTPSRPIYRFQALLPAVGAQVSANLYRPTLGPIPLRWIEPAYNDATGTLIYLQISNITKVNPTNKTWRCCVYRSIRSAQGSILPV